LFKDRHVLSMRASDKGMLIVGLNGPQARAVYDPFITQLHPQFLP